MNSLVKTVHWLLLLFALCFFFIRRRFLIEPVLDSYDRSLQEKQHFMN